MSNFRKKKPQHPLINSLNGPCHFTSFISTLLINLLNTHEKGRARETKKIENKRLAIPI